MRYPATGICTLIGLALCLFNATGYDPHNLFLMMFSVPMWLVELFTDLHRVDVWLMYILTVLSWALIGYLIDLGIARTRSKGKSRA
ncbi:hypothetical protein [Cohnella hongkongensis]|uniref:Uncharacterized protein n=1 Tax=Cohnella hongkongensis TaxID=178337 RepID=A0ABV9F4C0_9BACL